MCNDYRLEVDVASIVGDFSDPKDQDRVLGAGGRIRRSGKPSRCWRCHPGQTSSHGTRGRSRCSSGRNGLTGWTRPVPAAGVVRTLPLGTLDAAHIG
ncbi:MAG: hypothetical protein JWO25_2828 [Alphaproteobacteria bacterium]|nr:hypothetical protein [Alphaproteobacteria bacterium]